MTEMDCISDTRIIRPNSPAIASFPLGFLCPYVVVTSGPVIGSSPMTTPPPVIVPPSPESKDMGVIRSSCDPSLKVRLMEGVGSPPEAAPSLPITRKPKGEIWSVSIVRLLSMA